MIRGATLAGRRLPSPAALLACGLTAAALVWHAHAEAQGTRRQHGTHSHGVSRLEVAVDGRELTLRLESPAEDVVGFEHPPRDARHKDAIAKATATLKSADKLFQPSAEARCRLLVATVSNDLEPATPPPAAPAAPAKGAAPAGQDHAEFRLAAKWACEDASKLRHVDTTIFAAFPRMRRIDAQVATAAGQRSQVLSRDQARLGLSAP
jgi:hypothetical protein